LQHRHTHTTVFQVYHPDLQVTSKEQISHSLHLMTSAA